MTEKFSPLHIVLRKGSKRLDHSSLFAVGRVKA
jgi:hypothetical protein